MKDDGGSHSASGTEKDAVLGWDAENGASSPLPTRHSRRLRQASTRDRPLCKTASKATLSRACVSLLSPDVVDRSQGEQK